MLIVTQFLSSSKNVFYSFFFFLNANQNPDKNQNPVQTHALHLAVVSLILLNPEWSFHILFLF